MRVALQRTLNAACDPALCPVNTPHSAVVLWLLTVMCCLMLGGVLLVLSAGGTGMIYFVFAWVAIAIGLCLVIVLCMDAVTRPSN